jgi:hypothetical protein
MSILEQDLQTHNPMEAFTYGLKAPQSRRQYPGRFKPFLDFLKLEGSLNEQAKQFWFCISLNNSVVQSILGSISLREICLN